MKYGVWFLRLLFASWMIPAGLNHFVEIFPQPMGSQPLSMELIVALLESGLFDLVKAVELIAGIGVLFGIYTPLALLICLPVSFGVFYWDAPLEGWGSIAALFGYGTLLCNTLLCLAYFKSYRAMFALRANVSDKKPLVTAGRLVFGAWMVLFAANILFLSIWSAPVGTEPLAQQLMESLVNSRLLHVALIVQLFAGVLILAGIFVPLALCLQMNISTCALYWALVLDQQPLGIALTLVAFAFNGLLMLAYLRYYTDILQRHSVAIGEQTGSDSYDGLFVNPRGETSRAHFVPAMLTVLVVISFFWVLIPGRTAEFCMLVLLYPLYTVLSRRLSDMGQSAWLILIPALPMLLAFAIRLGYLSLGAAIDGFAMWIALALTGVFLAWGCFGADKTSPAYA